MSYVGSSNVDGMWVRLIGRACMLFDCLKVIFGVDDKEDPDGEIDEYVTNGNKQASRRM